MSRVQIIETFEQVKQYYFVYRALCSITHNRAYLHMHTIYWLQELVEDLDLVAVGSILGC